MRLEARSPKKNSFYGFGQLMLRPTIGMNQRSFFAVVETFKNKLRKKICKNRTCKKKGQAKHTKNPSMESYVLFHTNLRWCEFILDRPPI